MTTKTRLASFALLGAVAGLLGAPALAADVAATVKEKQAYTVSADDRVTVIYFTRSGETVTVVATAAGEDGARAMRAAHVLADGKTMALQLSSEGIGSRVLLTRVGDSLQIQRAARLVAG